MTTEEKVTSVVLTQRELTLIRVALLQRMDRLKGKQPISYEQTKLLLEGKLWECVKHFSKAEGK